MILSTHYNIEVELDDGTRCTWDSTDYPTLDKVWREHDIQSIFEKEPRARRLIFIEVTRHEVASETLILGSQEKAA